jgi:hypothetical protein
VGAVVKTHRFSILGWELRAIPHEVCQWLFGSHEKVDDEVRVVIEYFSGVERINELKRQIGAGGANDDGALDSLKAELSALQEQRKVSEGTVEKIIAGQVRETLAEQGIFNPIDEAIGLRVSFPPVNFELEKPPYLLVISPRDRIDTIREVLLKQEISLEEMESIEAMVDELGVSSLVVGIGGLGATYPTFVTNEAGLKFTLDAIAEEWVHQYLAFKPLGFLYLLDVSGVSRNYDIAVMNETVAGIVSQEIGSMVFEKYYSGYENRQEQPTEVEFDFNREMREIRRAVDDYLARGEVEQAEDFMEEKRQYLASMGYYIRKLNQAYFAFHGAYADSPTSIDPIGLEFKQLRSRSASLKDFLNTAAVMNSRQDLSDSIK